MRKVYSSDNPVMAGHIHSLLESNGIECHLRNMDLSGGIGELPINECWPEVWVIDDDEFHNAEKIISNTLSKVEQSHEWRCECGELIEGQFNACWSCGNESNY